MSLISTSDKIFVAGHRGLVGSAIVRKLQDKGYSNLCVKTRDQVDLENQQQVQGFFNSEKPDVVFVAAAKVGGIHANNAFRADFIYQNLCIQNNVIWGAHQAGVRRLVFLGSSCIYPKMAPQPMDESCLLTGPLEITNRPYAIAKIAGMELIEALRKQYKRDYFSVMPTNLYGPGDNFHPEHSHVLPALVRRFVEATKQTKTSIKVWGSGKPKREFLHADDCADAIVFLAENFDQTAINKSPASAGGWSHVNIGSGQEVSIAELATLIAKEAGYNGKIEYDTSKPDGTPRKLLNTDFLQSLGWQPNISLQAGLRQTIEWFKNHVKD